MFGQFNRFKILFVNEVGQKPILSSHHCYHTPTGSANRLKGPKTRSRRIDDNQSILEANLKHCYIEFWHHYLNRVWCEDLHFFCKEL